jgi:hypothetical protein
MVRPARVKQTATSSSQPGLGTPIKPVDSQWSGRGRSIISPRQTSGRPLDLPSAVELDFNLSSLFTSASDWTLIPTTHVWCLALSVPAHSAQLLLGHWHPGPRFARPSPLMHRKDVSSHTSPRLSHSVAQPAVDPLPGMGCVRPWPSLDQPVNGPSPHLRTVRLPCGTGAPVLLRIYGRILNQRHPLHV